MFIQIVIETLKLCHTGLLNFFAQCIFHTSIVSVFRLKYINENNDIIFLLLLSNYIVYLPALIVFHLIIIICINIIFR